MVHCFMLLLFVVLILCLFVMFLVIDTRTLHIEKKMDGGRVCNQKEGWNKDSKRYQLD